jgi:maltooligosyltrehalose trehalohydrolase
MAQRRMHRMPFGAEVTPDGAVRFRLWAPAARRVDVVLYGGERTQTVPLHPAQGGWFELTTGAARAGSRYRYRIDGGLEVPDPASRFNPDDVGGPSLVVDPGRFEWTDDEWRARPWHEAVVYELHTGTFSREGTFAGIVPHLDHLAQLGVTVIELMPVGDFPGRRGWGYDGVLPFAPDSAYGTPEDLKALVVAAHARGLAVVLDVVYNHFGPEGNYLGSYAPEFFSAHRQTPWGAAVNFDGPGSRTVRDFFIHNSLYWLTEYHLDGLRLDAVHAMRDESGVHIVKEIAQRVRAEPARDRNVYLVLENVANEARRLGRPGAPDSCDAQWNDDLHHCLHVILTGESDGYYADFAQPHSLLCRSLAEGFAYQGEYSQYHGRDRGEPSGALAPTAFVSFLQNHDQIGNRALGERLIHLTDGAALRAAVALVLLAPSPPMLFMGEEWGAPEPFPYFCDFEGELAARVREGRRREFAAFRRFAAAASFERLADPGAESTVRAAQLDWDTLAEPAHASLLEYYRHLLAVRRREIVPRIPYIRPGGHGHAGSDGAFTVNWSFSDGSAQHVLVNLTGCPSAHLARPAGRVLFATHAMPADREPADIPPWSVIWTLEEADVERKGDHGHAYPLVY